MADQERTISYDCRYFLGDRPCVWHKREGLICECERYVRIQERVLVIKLDAMGDVLRTTSLLPAMDAASPGAAITWVTRPEAVPLLKHNPYLTEVVPYGPDTLVHLSSRTFDRVINLDAGKTSAGLASMARAKEKVGYVLQEEGHVVGTNDAARAWLRMGVFDDLKKQNDQTYQAVMCSILGLSHDHVDYVLELTDDERAAGRAHLERLGIDAARPVLGIHTGGGGRWRLKQWNEPQFVAFLQLMRQEHGEVQLLLFGGPLEREQNARLIAAAGGGVFDAGCDNEVRHFAALVAGCNVLLSGDTLAMHIALSTDCRAVVLFGPTSHAEIELFDRGEKIIPNLDCLCCYKMDCDFVPNCMDSISVGMVHDAVVRQLAAADVVAG